MKKKTLKKVGFDPGTFRLQARRFFPLRYESDLIVCILQYMHISYIELKKKV